MWDEADWLDCKTYNGDGSMMFMDPFHVSQIYQFVVNNSFDLIMEIGSWDGFSTSALVQAQMDGQQFSLMCCDVEIRDQLLEVVLPGTVLIRAKSVDFLQCLNCTPDLAVIDGDHSLETCLAELTILLNKGIQTIIAHDVGRQGQPGPVAVKKQLWQDPNWRVWFDDRPRPGQETQRGLLIATRDPSIVLPLPATV